MERLRVGCCLVRAAGSERRRLQEQTEQLQNERNVKSKGIGQAKAQGQDIAPFAGGGQWPW